MMLTGHFQSFFIFIFLVSLTLNLKKITVIQLIKKFWPYQFLVAHIFPPTCPSIAYLVHS